MVDLDGGFGWIRDKVPPRRDRTYMARYEADQKT